MTIGSLTKHLTLSTRCSARASAPTTRSSATWTSASTPTTLRSRPTWTRTTCRLTPTSRWRSSPNWENRRVDDDESQCPMFHPNKDPFSSKSVFARFCSAAWWRKWCFHAFLFLAACGKTISAQVVKLKVGGRATVYVGTTLKVRCPVKQYDKWANDDDDQVIIDDECDDELSIELNWGFKKIFGLTSMFFLCQASDNLGSWEHNVSFWEETRKTFKGCHHHYKCHDNAFYHHERPIRSQYLERVDWK